MKSPIVIAAALCALLNPVALQAASASGSIDRHVLVTRHNVLWNEAHGQIPLGNGEFCFNADGTGLETFGGNTLSHWAWHSAPLPPDCTPADIPPTGTVERGRLRGPMQKAAEKPQLDGWMFRNPHPINLARVRLIRGAPQAASLAARLGSGAELRPDEIRNLSRVYDLWTGLHTSRFDLDGQRLTIETIVHPAVDLVAVRADSPLFREGKLEISLDFPYPAAGGGDSWAGDWSRPEAHSSELAMRPGEDRAVILRTADASAYSVSLAWSKGCTFRKKPEPPRKKLAIVNARFGNEDVWIDVTAKVAAAIRDDQLAITPTYEALGDPLPGRSKKLQLSYSLDGVPLQVEVQEGQPLAIQAASGKHCFILSAAGAESLELVCAFSSSASASPSASVLSTASVALPTVLQTRQAAAERWKDFWVSGGAIDLSESKDPRWRELERRIVLSQYQMAAQSAGSWPPAETGLMGIDFWSSQFHMEMVWWHLAHYGLWDRWPMAERALDCYRKFLPIARQLAGQFDYRGARWGKQVGREGPTAPWDGSFVLNWQQPHPLFFAELEYRLRPTRATLEKWEEIVSATADYMADFPTRGADGFYHLEPIMPPSEQGVTRDTVFDLAYWHWGLDQAGRWRERLGLAREPRWDEVRSRLAPLPVADGLFVHSAEWRDTYTKRAWEHPDPVGVLGMLPPQADVDGPTAQRTVVKVWQTWDWRRCWGWDFPWMAMAAARVGEPRLAVEALLEEAGGKNHYDIRGVNTGGPCPYLPGNGGLLYAVAMMAAGWDGCPRTPAPGFPDDGSWVVKWEGLRPAP